MHVSYLFSNLHMLQMIGTETQKHILIIVFSVFSAIYIYMCVLLLSPAHSAQIFFLGRTRICCWPFRPIQCNADAWPSDVLNHCVLLGGCLSKSYVKRWVICKRLLEERLRTLAQDNK